MRKIQIVCSVLPKLMDFYIGKVAFMNKPFTIKLAAGTYLTFYIKLFGA